jgi:Sporulation and spore germination
MKARATAAAALLGLTLAVSACGVPSQDTAKKTEAKDVPFGLLDENSGVDSINQLGDRDVVIFLAKNGRLIRAGRKVAPPVTLERVLRKLGQGPTRAEVATGTRSALPDGESFESVTLSGGTATVDLSPPFTALSGNDQLLALAQIVWSLTARPGIGQVQFTLGGAAIDIPRANGSLTPSPVSRDDYLSLSPP